MLRLGAFAAPWGCVAALGAFAAPENTLLGSGVPLVLGRIAAVLEQLARPASILLFMGHHTPPSSTLLFIGAPYFAFEHITIHRAPCPAFEHIAIYRVPCPAFEHNIIHWSIILRIRAHYCSLEHHTPPSSTLLFIEHHTPLSSTLLFIGASYSAFEHITVHWSVILRLRAFFCVLDRL